MATITKTLRSGGDYEDVDSVVAYLVGLADGQDYIINIQGNTQFVGRWYLNLNASFTGSITIRTDPSELSLGPATLKYVKASGDPNIFKLSAGGGMVAFNLTELKLMASEDVMMGLEATLATFKMENCVLIKDKTGVFIYCPNNLVTNLNIRNNCFVLSNTGLEEEPEIRIILGEGNPWAATINLDNNIFLCYITTTPISIIICEFVVTIATLTIRTNSFYNYSGGTLSLSYGNATSRTVTGNLNPSNPLCNDNMVQAETDTIDTMGARDFKFVVGSPCRDVVSVNYPTKDIFGTART